MVTLDKKSKMMEYMQLQLWSELIDTDSPCGAMGKKKLFAFTDFDLKKTGFDEEKETAAN